MKKKPNTDLTTVNPQQTQFTFGSIKFSSKFCGGNLAKVVQNSEYQYDLWISPDSAPYLSCTNYRTWFYFGVEGFKPNTSVTFSVKNMNNQGKLYTSGLKPAFYQSKGGPIGQNFKRIPGKVNFSYTDDGFKMSFYHTFNESDTFQEARSMPQDLVEEEEVPVKTYFAFTYPFSFQEAVEQAEKIYEDFKEDDEIYVHRENLMNSLEGRRMDLLTITGQNGKLEEKEERLEGCFPEGEKVDRPNKFNKPTVVFSARVHPGETAASFVLNGILKLILDKNDPHAQLLRKNFQFKIIPILNPDGVARGYYRGDTKNQNLNRYYLNPTIEAQPTIYAAKKMIEQQNACGNLKFFIDLHAHASKKGIFMFGNNLPKTDEMIKNMLLPRLISLYSVSFDFQACGFSEKMMSCKDKKDGLSREGAGRVAIWKATGCVHSYTLECNYHGGRRVGQLPKMYDCEKEEIIADQAIHNNSSKQYQVTNDNNKMIMPPFTVDIFEDAGKATCVAFLDYINDNPRSRLPKSQFKSLEGLQQDLMTASLPKGKRYLALAEKRSASQREQSEPPPKTIKSVPKGQRVGFGSSVPSAAAKQGAGKPPLRANTQKPNAGQQKAQSVQRKSSAHKSRLIFKGAHQNVLQLKPEEVKKDTVEEISRNASELRRIVSRSKSSKSALRPSMENISLNQSEIIAQQSPQIEKVLDISQHRIRSQERRYQTNKSTSNVNNDSSVSACKVVDFNFQPASLAVQIEGNMLLKRMKTQRGKGGCEGRGSKGGASFLPSIGKMNV